VSLEERGAHVEPEARVRVRDDGAFDGDEQGGVRPGIGPDHEAPGELPGVERPFDHECQLVERELVAEAVGQWLDGQAAGAARRVGVAVVQPAVDANPLGTQDVLRRGALQGHPQERGWSLRGRRRPELLRLSRFRSLLPGFALGGPPVSPEDGSEGRVCGDGVGGAATSGTSGSAGCWARTGQESRPAVQMAAHSPRCICGFLSGTRRVVRTREIYSPIGAASLHSSTFFRMGLDLRSAPSASLPRPLFLTEFPLPAGKATVRDGE
jgi:hypothetical protein